MTWICPECKKEFRNTNQGHSCYIVSIEEHLKNRSDTVVTTYHKLMHEVNKFGRVTLNPVKTSIQVKSGATFLSIRLKKNSLEIEFQSNEEIKSAPVYKNFIISNNRVLSCAVIESPKDVNGQLLMWLRRAYGLVSSS